MIQYLEEKADEIGLGIETTKKLLEKFVDVTRLDLENLKDAAEEGEWARVRQTAHHIKGAAVNFNLTEITEAADRLETISEAPDQSRIAELIEDIEDQYDRLRTLVNDFDGHN
ncbi:MAG: Hpt domain-containing protein [Spirochaetia bacterium]